LARRLGLLPDEYARLNGLLLAGFKGLDLQGVGCIHIYLPMLQRLEPDTVPIIHWLKGHHPHIKRVFPKTDFASLRMDAYADDGALKLEENTLGIFEPVTGNLVDVGDIDMVIVPLLAFDTKGYRVGYGMGFYDRFMAQCKPGTRFAGLSFFEPVEAIADIDGYDIPLHLCITPEKVWVF